MLNEVSGHFGDTLTELLGKAEIWIFLVLVGVSIAVPFIAPQEVVNIFIRFLELTWPIWLFFFLFEIAKPLYLFIKQEQFKEKEMAGEKNALLELRIPRALEKGPQAMEQILLAIHGMTGSPGDWNKIWLDGETMLWFSLEMVSIGGEVHFYVRIPKRSKNLVEAVILSSYSDIEVVEVPDYISIIPETTADLYAEEKDIWGTEIKLAKDSMYPIRTYASFGTSEENATALDPASSFLEILGKLKTGEFAGVQIVIQPAAKDWGKQWAEALDKLRTPKVVGTTQLTDPKETTATIDAVARNLAKSAFKTLIRVMYVGPTTVFKDGSGFVRGGITGAFNQYSSPTLNAFKANGAVGTSVDKWKKPYILNDVRLEMKKQRMLWNYRKRKLAPQSFVEKFFTSFSTNGNNSESFELALDGVATIFHLPTSVVLTTPHMRRVESKKSGPPVGLAIFGEESQLEKFGG
ncbi:MAG: Uncharacterized protein LiPW41_418 [Parcubacteria group bacterium LiPW_41]|nr:MAG: Uncharacterized protein LiPW41_418 [Parcubacteria group bacterium LiPW_41]